MLFSAAAVSASCTCKVVRVADSAISICFVGLDWASCCFERVGDRGCHVSASRSRYARFFVIDPFICL